MERNVLEISPRSKTLATLAYVMHKKDIKVLLDEVKKRREVKDPGLELLVAEERLLSGFNAFRFGAAMAYLPMRYELDVTNPGFRVEESDIEEDLKIARMEAPQVEISPVFETFPDIIEEAEEVAALASHSIIDAELIGPVFRDYLKFYEDGYRRSQYGSPIFLAGALTMLRPIARKLRS